MADNATTTGDGNDDNGTSSITLHLTVTAEQGAPRVPLKIQPTITTTMLRQQVSTATKIPITSLKLIFRGRLIPDDDTKIAVDEFKLEDGSVLHCMGKPVTTSSTSNNDEAGMSPAIAPSAAAAAAPTVPSAAAAALNLLPTPSVAAGGVGGNLNNLQTALQTLRSYNPPKVYQTALQTLDKILDNITTHPMEEKYRKVKKQNAAFQRRLGGLQGGHDAMLASGFVVELDGGEQVYMIRPSPEAWPRLKATKAMIASAVRDAQISLHPATAGAAVPPIIPPGVGGMPGFPSGGMGGMMPNAMQQQAAANLMSNPAALQQMLQDPMVQNMMRNDPRLANNPMMQQAMQEMANNPQMAQEVAAMMQNPAMQQQMAQMMQAHGGGGGMMMPGGAGGLFGAAAAPNTGTGGAAAPPANNNNNNNNNAGQSDEDQTEEEMIAEAIRRSLQEGG